MSDTYYYACSYPLGEGSTVLPGNWARVLKLYTPNYGDPWTVVREKIFEEVRAMHYKEKPSRFHSLFVCETQEAIVEFIQTNQRVMDIPYEVELSDDNAQVHKGCLQIQSVDNWDNHLTIEDKAHIYWKGENIQKPEYITTSPARIVRRVNA